VLFRYVKGLLELPLLAPLVVGRPKADRITLRNRVEIEIHTANFRATRGYTIVAAVVDELAFFRSEDSANPALARDIQQTLDVFWKLADTRPARQDVARG